jgi:hypothetical protein
VGLAVAVQHFEVRGRVVEYGGAQGIGDVEVTIERYKGPAGSSFVERVPAGAARTDASGSFVFSLDTAGTYRLTVAKEGYEKGGGIFDRTNWTSKEISVDQDRPSGELRFVLARPGEIIGRVVDGDTHKPVAGMPVRVIEFGFERGRRVFMPASLITTDPDGRFAAPKLPPADYVIVLQPRIRPALVLGPDRTIPGETPALTKFTEKDIKAVDRDYPWTYWPGGPDAADAFPVALGSGAQFDVGTLNVNEVPKYRVRVKLLDEQCQPGDHMGIEVNTPSHPMSDGFRNLPCGQEALLRGFAPGSYQLEVMGEGTKRGWAPLTIVDENTSVVVPVSRGVTIDGKVLVPEGASRPDLKSMRIVLFPFGSFVQNEPAFPDAAGRLTIRNVLVRDFELDVTGVPTTHYLKEIRYNSHRLAEEVLAVDGNAQTHTLEVVLGENPATVSGTVVDDDKPVRRSHVVLIRWPPNSRDLFSSVSGIESDENGRFQFAGVAPGEYRILAVAAEDRAKLNRPNALASLLDGAEKLSLGERQYQDMKLTLTRP